MRGEPTLEVSCDRCKSYYKAVTLSWRSGGYTEEHVNAQLTADGWRVEGGADVCPPCLRVEEEERERQAAAALAAETCPKCGMEGYYTEEDGERICKNCGAKWWSY